MKPSDEVKKDTRQREREHARKLADNRQILKDRNAARREGKRKP